MCTTCVPGTKEKIYTRELNVYTAYMSVPVRVHLKISLQKQVPFSDYLGLSSSGESSLRKSLYLKTNSETRDTGIQQI